MWCRRRLRWSSWAGEVTVFVVFVMLLSIGMVAASAGGDARLAESMHAVEDLAVEESKQPIHHSHVHVHHKHVTRRAAKLEHMALGDSLTPTTETVTQNHVHANSKKGSSRVNHDEGHTQLRRAFDKGNDHDGSGDGRGPARVQPHHTAHHYRRSLRHGAELARDLEASVFGQQRQLKDGEGEGERLGSLGGASVIAGRSMEPSGADSIHVGDTGGLSVSVGGDMDSNKAISPKFSKDLLEQDELTNNDSIFHNRSLAQERLGAEAEVINSRKQPGNPVRERQNLADDRGTRQSKMIKNMQPILLPDSDVAAAEENERGRERPVRNVGERVMITEGGSSFGLNTRDKQLGAIRSHAKSRKSGSSRSNGLQLSDPEMSLEEAKECSGQDTEGWTEFENGGKATTDGPRRDSGDEAAQKEACKQLNNGNDVTFVDCCTRFSWGSDSVSAKIFKQCCEPCRSRLMRHPTCFPGLSPRPVGREDQDAGKGCFDIDTTCKVDWYFDEESMRCQPCRASPCICSRLGGGGGVVYNRCQGQGATTDLSYCSCSSLPEGQSFLLRGRHRNHDDRLAKKRLENLQGILDTYANDMPTIQAPPESLQYPTYPGIKDVSNYLYSSYVRMRTEVDMKESDEMTNNFGLYQSDIYNLAGKKMEKYKPPVEGCPAGSDLDNSLHKMCYPNERGLAGIFYDDVEGFSRLKSRSIVHPCNLDAVIQSGLQMLVKDRQDQWHLSTCPDFGRAVERYDEQIVFERVEDVSGRKQDVPVRMANAPPLLVEEAGITEDLSHTKLSEELDANCGGARGCHELEMRKLYSKEGNTEGKYEYRIGDITYTALRHKQDMTAAEFASATNMNRVRPFWIGDGAGGGAGGSRWGRPDARWCVQRVCGDETAALFKGDSSAASDVQRLTKLLIDTSDPDNHFAGLFLDSAHTDEAALEELLLDADRIVWGCRNSILNAGYCENEAETFDLCFHKCQLQTPWEQCGDLKFNLRRFDFAAASRRDMGGNTKETEIKKVWGGYPKFGLVVNPKIPSDDVGTVFKAPEPKKPKSMHKDWSRFWTTTPSRSQKDFAVCEAPTQSSSESGCYDTSTPVDPQEWFAAFINTNRSDIQPELQYDKNNLQSPFKGGASRLEHHKRMGQRWADNWYYNMLLKGMVFFCCRRRAFDKDKRINLDALWKLFDAQTYECPQTWMDNPSDTCCRYKELVTEWWDQKVALPKESDAEWDTYFYVQKIFGVVIDSSDANEWIRPGWYDSPSLEEEQGKDTGKPIEATNHNMQPVSMRRIKDDGCFARDASRNAEAWERYGDHYWDRYGAGFSTPGAHQNRLEENPAMLLPKTRADWDADMPEPDMLSKHPGQLEDTASSKDEDLSSASHNITGVNPDLYQSPYYAHLASVILNSRKGYFPDFGADLRDPAVLRYVWNVDKLTQRGGYDVCAFVPQVRQPFDGLQHDEDFADACACRGLGCAFVEGECRNLGTSLAGADLIRAWISYYDATKLDARKAVADADQSADLDLWRSVQGVESPGVPACFPRIEHEVFKTYLPEYDHQTGIETRGWTLGPKVAAVGRPKFEHEVLVSTQKASTGVARMLQEGEDDWLGMFEDIKMDAERGGAEICHELGALSKENCLGDALTAKRQMCECVGKDIDSIAGDLSGVCGKVTRGLKLAPCKSPLATDEQGQTPPVVFYPCVWRDDLNEGQGRCVVGAPYKINDERSSVREAVAQDDERTEEDSYRTYADLASPPTPNASQRG